MEHLLIVVHLQVIQWSVNGMCNLISPCFSLSLLHYSVVSTGGTFGSWTAQWRDHSPSLPSVLAPGSAMPTSMACWWASPGAFSFPSASSLHATTAPRGLCGSSCTLFYRLVRLWGGNVVPRAVCVCVCVCCVLCVRACVRACVCECNYTCTYLCHELFYMCRVRTVWVGVLCRVWVGVVEDVCTLRTYYSHEP